MHTTSPVTHAHPVRLTLSNNKNMHVGISTRGATLLSWSTTDRYGRFADILLGYASTDGYERNSSYFGSLVGRWANRIAGARFTLDGHTYALTANEGEHQLHGGPDGFHQALWEVVQSDAASVTLRHDSPAGEGGFPGNVTVHVQYRLRDDGSLHIDYTATTDAPTPVNLTSHPYFNLNGGVSGIGDHQLLINAERYLQTDQAAIPVEAVSVAGTAFDFRHAAPIGSRLVWPDQQIRQAGGFDHCYCLNDNADKVLREVARVYDPASGRALTVSTTETGLQFYTGHGLAGVKGKNATPYAAYDGFCLEAQAWPNQINGPDAEAVVLRPGNVYRQTTVYRVGVQDIDALNLP